ncbi:MAG: hypothetical protein SPG03_00675 [Veillonella caviae]|uniref:hypothetical protein n=1 Tax=Veillonella caviae TaxID=248316 RepID=UPI002A909CB0|nr:hypothetical protein [Veillonella caviae]MDY5480901.1 hypothetical protein [Veillonella caviae]
MDYVFVLDENGIRQTSYVVGVHADTLEETEQLAKQSYPTSTILSGDSDMQVQFTNGKAYVNGEFVEPPIVEYIPTKEEKINAIKAEYDPRFKTLEEAQRRLLLMGKPTNAISAQYIKLNSEMVARIKEVQ